MSKIRVNDDLSLLSALLESFGPRNTKLLRSVNFCFDEFDRKRCFRDIHKLLLDCITEGQKALLQLDPACRVLVGCDVDLCVPEDDYERIFPLIINARTPQKSLERLEQELDTDLLSMGEEREPLWKIRWIRRVVKELRKEFTERVSEAGNG